MQGTIIILGGYGAVGARLSRLLAPVFPGRVIIAGRNDTKAETLARQIGHGAAALEIDASNPLEYGKLFALPCSVIISCIELPASSSLATEALRRGVHYTELTATYEAHERLMQLDELAHANGASAVIGVGLMPGLSNVLAADAAARLDRADNVEINLMLGLGEAHGLDAIKWTLRHLNETFALHIHGRLQTVKSLTDPCRTTLLHEKRPRRFYRFNFSDQHMLARSLRVPVSSRLAFDSRAITAAAAGLRKVGLLSPISERAASVVHQLTSHFAVGSDMFALQVEASGQMAGEPATIRLLVSGRNEAEATALVAAYVVDELAQGAIAPGVHPIEAAVQSACLYDYLQRHQMKFMEEPASH